LNEATGGGLHRLRQNSWFLFGIYTPVALLISFVITYISLRPTATTKATWQDAPAMPLPYRLACPEPAAVGNTYLLLVTGQDQAQHLLDGLCAGVASLGVSLEAYWGLSDDDRRKLLKEGQPAIVFGRTHLVESKAVFSLQSYQKIAKYPPYTSNLIATSPIELSRRGLSGKRIGLREDQSSRSGRLVPISVFRSIGLAPTHYVTVLAESHGQLREFLASDKVDVIASYWGDTDKVNHPGWHAIEIGSGVEGPSWYMRPDLADSPFNCIFQRSLLEAAAKDSDLYYQKVELMDDDC
jgi:phosphonate transport system substrate-binding protein